jgi:thymidylate kinase
LDANILLTAPFEVLVERYGARDRRDTIEARVVSDWGFAERYERALEGIMRGQPHFREFDTSKSEPQEVAREVAAWLRELNLLRP